MAAVVEPQRSAAEPISCHLGTDEHGRREEHHHHPRCRQPARPDLTVLGFDGTAVLHRLGQDHAVGHGRPRPGDGRQAGPARQAVHHRCGATLPSGSQAWTSRLASASAFPILSILLNNFSMAIELKVMPVSTEKYRSTDISGDYAAMAKRVRRLWRGAWALSPAISRRRSSAASSRRRTARRRCWNSSPRRRRGFPSSDLVRAASLLRDATRCFHAARAAIAAVGGAVVLCGRVVVRRTPRSQVRDALDRARGNSRRPHR